MFLFVGIARRSYRRKILQRCCLQPRDPAPRRGRYGFRLCSNCSQRWSVGRRPVEYERDLVRTHFPPAVSQVRTLAGAQAELRPKQPTAKKATNRLTRPRVLEVRIHLPPAESQARTCLSREFAFLGREAAVFRGCPGRDERPGSVETRGRGNIWPKGGDISVGPYFSTAPP